MWTWAHVWVDTLYKGYGGGASRPSLTTLVIRGGWHREPILLACVWVLLCGSLAHYDLIHPLTLVSSSVKWEEFLSCQSHEVVVKIK